MGGASGTHNVTVSATVNGLTATFSSILTGFENELVTYQWDFGDGNTSTNANPVHTYNQTGTYYVKLSVTSSTGSIYLSDDYQISINDSSITNVSLRAIPDVKNDRLYSFFTPAQSQDENTTYTWDFGDGSEIITGTNNLIDHVFPQYNRTYKVSVTMRSSTEEITNSILISLPKPFLHIQGTYIDNYAVFMPMVSGVNIQEAEFQWDFGDGKTGTSTLKSPSVEHTYAQAGTYTVKVLMVSSLLAEPMEAELTVNIANSGLSCGLISESVADNFNLTYKYSAVAFIEDTSDGKILYKWVYDGQETSDWKEAVVTDKNVLIEDTKVYTQYQQERKVSLKLKKINDTENKNVIEQTGVFIYKDTSYSVTADAAPGLTKTFTVKTNGFSLKNAVYYWSFGDGTETTTSEPTATHIYTEQGTKEVSVTIRSNLLSFKEYTAQTSITVIDKTVNSISVGDITVKNVSEDGLTYTFAASVITDPADAEVEYHWVIDGTSYTDKEPVHKFKYGQTYTVSLTVTAKDDSTKTASAPEYVGKIDVPTLSITMSGGMYEDSGIAFYYEYQTYTVNAKLNENIIAIENPHVEWDFDWRFDDRGHVSSDSTSIVFAYGVNENGEHDNTVGRPILQFLTIRAVITGSNLASPITVTKTITLSTK